MTVVVRRPRPPLTGLVAAIVYRTGEQSRTSVEKILPGPETGLWINLNRDAFRSFGEAGRVHQVPGAMVAGPTGRASVIWQMADDARPDPAVVAAAGALARGSRVAEVADRLGLLTRTLRRRFTARIGLSPKRFGRVQRLQRLVRGLDGQFRVDWAATAARHGYCDQAHLADEFQELAGVTPAGYLRSRVNGPNHLRFDVRA